MGTLHAYLPTGEIHIPYQWSYANAAARTGATGFGSNDLGKFARQTDDNSIWMLTATTPTWVQVNGTGSGGQTNTVTGQNGVTNTGDNVDAVLEPSYGSSANTVCEGNDSRLSDARTPTAHASSHENGGADEISVAGLSGELADDQPPKAHALGGIAHSADTLANLNLKVSDATLIDTGDSRLSDARTPTAHASTHQSGGSDAIKLDDLAAPDDNTDLDASTSKHGLLPKLGGGTSDFLRADGSWQPPPGGVDTTAIHKATAAEISAMTSKASPVSADVFVIEDSADSYNKKKVLVSNLPGGVDTTAIHKATAAEIAAITQKTSLDPDDLLLIEDSEASNAKKRIELGDLILGNINDYQEDSHLTESSTTGDTWLDKIEIVFTPKYTGRYAITAGFFIYCSSGSAYNWSDAQLVVHGTMHAYQNYFGLTPHFFFFAVSHVMEAGVEETITLQYRRNGTAATAYMGASAVNAYRITDEATP